MKISHDEPAVKGEGAHRRLREHGRDGVHRVGAKMRRQRNGFAAPLDDAGADFGDFHLVLIDSSKVQRLDFGNARVQIRMNAITCSEPEMTSAGV